MIDRTNKCYHGYTFTKHHAKNKKVINKFLLLVENKEYFKVFLIKTRKNDLDQK